MPAGAGRKQIQSDYLMLPAAAAWSRTVCKLVKGPNLSLSSLWFKRQGKKVLSSVDKQEKMYKTGGNFTMGLIYFILGIEKEF